MKVLRTNIKKVEDTTSNNKIWKCYVPNIKKVEDTTSNNKIWKCYSLI